MNTKADSVQVCNRTLTTILNDDKMMIIRAGAEFIAPVGQLDGCIGSKGDGGEEEGGEEEGGRGQR